MNIRILDIIDYTILLTMLKVELSEETKRKLDTLTISTDGICSTDTLTDRVMSTIAYYE